MLADSTKRLINQFVQFIGDKNIVIWGANDFGEEVFYYLGKLGYIVDCFIDSNKDKQKIEFCGKGVYDPESIINQNNKLYIFIVMSFYKEVKDMLLNCQYEEGNDYLYFRDEHVTLEIANNYNDLLGNQIIGNPKNINSKIVFQRSNNKIVFEEMEQY